MLNEFQSANMSHLGNNHQRMFKQLADPYAEHTMKILLGHQHPDTPAEVRRHSRRIRERQQWLKTMYTILGFTNHGPSRVIDAKF